MLMKRIKVGDKVKIIAGKAKNSDGIVEKIKGDKVIVKGANLVKKHVKPNPRNQEPGGIKEFEAYIHVSNVGLLNPETNKVDKIGFKFIEHENKHKRKVRYFKSNGEVVDL